MNFLSSQTHPFCHNKNHIISILSLSSMTAKSIRWVTALRIFKHPGTKCFKIIYHGYDISHNNIRVIYHGYDISSSSHQVVNLKSQIGLRSNIRSRHKLDRPKKLKFQPSSNAVSHHSGVTVNDVQVNVFAKHYEQSQWNECYHWMRLTRGWKKLFEDRQNSSWSMLEVKNLKGTVTTAVPVNFLEQNSSSSGKYQWNCYCDRLLITQVTQLFTLSRIVPHSTVPSWYFSLVDSCPRRLNAATGAKPKKGYFLFVRDLFFGKNLVYCYCDWQKNSLKR